MFATEQQLQYLARAKNWYVDGTFKLCRPPFTQLLTVNAFVKQDDHAKQVPPRNVGEEQEGLPKGLQTAARDTSNSACSEADNPRLRESSLGRAEKPVS